MEDVSLRVHTDRAGREGGAGTDRDIELTVIAVIADTVDAVARLRSYRPALEALGIPCEILCIVDAGKAPGVARELGELAKTWPGMEIYPRRRWAGEDTELAMVQRRARGARILTLPGWGEVVPGDITRLFEAGWDADMATCARRRQPVGALRRRLIAALLRALFGQAPQDMFCRVRLCRREVLEEVGGFGVRQHFIPVIAAQRGYSVEEVEVAGAAPEAGGRRFSFRPFGHVRALFDAVTLFLVLKFLYRPLRFFGAIGVPVFLAGFVLTGILGFGRLFLGVALADRPILILSTLMLVLGVQIIALGLVGEIIIFANSRTAQRREIARITRRAAGEGDSGGTPGQRGG